MTDTLPSNVFVAIATVVAALIAGLISVVTLTLTKEQKTSEFRQAWIDGLRQELSEFLACARAMARASEEMKAYGEDYSSLPFAISNGNVADIRRNMAIAFYRIKLRLNADETEHKELLRLLVRVTEEQNEQFQTQSYNSEKTLKIIELAADYSRPVLKTEWNRVKSGEPQFRFVRNWIIPIVFFLCASFAWSLVNFRITT